MGQADATNRTAPTAPAGARNALDAVADLRAFANAIAIDVHHCRMDIAKVQAEQAEARVILAAHRTALRELRAELDEDPTDPVTFWARLRWLLFGTVPK